MRQTITFLLMAVFASVLSAQTTVNIQGDPYGGNPYATITDAITAANDGDVILITGVHTEPISIGKSITLRGTDPTTDIIQAAVSASTDGTGSRVVYLDGNNGTPITPLNITLENIGIRNGNASSNGGGIFSDKITGLVTLKNLIIENNYTAKNGGGLAFDGSNANIVECTIRNNTATTDGGGIIIAPNNGAAINCNIDIKQSLLDANTGRNGGGIWINGSNASSYNVDLNIENSTISNNTATSPSGGNGGGAILSTSPGNVTLKLVHATVFNNTHAALLKSGLKFLNTSTNFSAYNSIIVSTDDVSIKAIDFANSNTTNVVNCILGGLNAAPALLDDVAKNNLKGRTATESGLDFVSGLQSLGGNTQVYAILDKAGFVATTADDYCTAATGITLPTIDQRGYTREGVADAGAFEFGGTLGLGDNIYNSAVRIFPNPASDYFMVPKALIKAHYGIYDITGKNVKQGIITSERIDIDLNSGLYLFKAETNLSTITKKIIVK